LNVEETDKEATRLRSCFSSTSTVYV